MLILNYIYTSQFVYWLGFVFYENFHSQVKNKFPKCRLIGIEHFTSFYINSLDWYLSFYIILYELISHEFLYSELFWDGFNFQIETGIN